MMWHPLLKPIEEKIQRPLAIVQYRSYFQNTVSLVYCLEVDVTASGDEAFWQQVREEVGLQRWRELLQKWSGKKIEWGRIAPHSYPTCPEFEKLETLICWAYELFLGKSLDPDFVKWYLKICEPWENVSW